MTLRIPTSYGNQQILSGLQAAKARYNTLQEQIATGKRIINISDDPTGAALVVNLQNSTERNEQYVRQIESARSFLTATDTALGAVDESLMRLMELGTKGLQAVTAGNGGAIVPEVDAITTHLLTIANTQEQGKYLFAGTMTTTKPYPAAGASVANAGVINLDITSSASVATNIPGDQVFVNVFQAVTDLRAALVANNQANVQTALGELDTALSTNLSARTEVGGRQNSLDQIQTTLESFNLTLKSIQASYEDVDYPTAITQANQEDIGQKAAFSVLSRANRQNLFDFLA